MRRIPLAVLALAFAALSVTLAPAVALVAQSSQPGSDAEISRLRATVAANPGDLASKAALLQALEAARARLLAQAEQLQGEISTLRGAAAQAACGGRPPVRVGGAIAPPQRTHHVNPSYPAEALAARVAGVVLAEIVVDCAGEVASTSVLRGVPALNEAAVAAIRQWRYRPTLLNGNPVPVIMTVTVSFTLDQP